MLIRRALLAIAAACLASCTSAPERPAARPASAAAPTASPPRHDAPALIVGGEPITAAALAPLLEEAAGGAVVEEVALDRLLAREIRRRGVQLPADADAAEREALIQRLAEEAGVDRDAAYRLLEETRRRRGLGPRRFQALLDRNAMLRALVRGAVEVTDAEVALAHRIRDGERRVLRLIAVPSGRDAANLRDELVAADPVSRSARFAQAALERSTDPSGSAGGLLPPLSTADPAYPSALRTAAASLQPGEISPVLAIGGSHVLVLLERIVPPADRTLDEARDEIRAALTIRKERLAMEQLARELIERGEVSVLDRDLGWSWAAHRGVQR